MLLAAAAQAHRAAYGPLRGAFRNFTTSIAPAGILAAYQRLVKEGVLHPDGSQIAAVQALQLLQGVLAAEAFASEASAEHDPTAAPPPPASAVQGGYLHGPVGRGKTTLLDLFARTMPPHVIVRRQPVDMLLAHVNERAAQQQRLAAAAAEAAFGPNGGPPPAEEEHPAESVAREVAASCHLLCIDKLRVAGPAEAVAISRFTEALLREGCWLAFTSRRPLGDLLDGFVERPRDPTTPAGGFIHLCNTHLLQINLSGGRIYSHNGAADDTATPRVSSPSATAAAAAPGPRCHVGPGASAALRGSWGELVKSSGGREAGATVSLRFFGQNTLYLSKALLVDGGQTVSPAEGEKAVAGGGSEGSDGGGGCGTCGAGGPAPRAVVHEHAEQAAADAAEGRAPAPAPLPPAAPRPAGRVAAAFFTFPRLCAAHALPRGPPGAPAAPGATPPGPLSAIDCLAIAESGCEAVFIDAIPILTPQMRDAAMRFVTLIDVLWDHGTPLHIAAAAPPEELFRPLLSAALERGIGGAPDIVETTHTAAAGAASAADAHVHASGGGATGREAAKGDHHQVLGYAEKALLAEEVLAYQRAAARLTELTGGLGAAGGGGGGGGGA